MTRTSDAEGDMEKREPGSSARFLSQFGIREPDPDEDYEVVAYSEGCSTPQR